MVFTSETVRVRVVSVGSERGVAVVELATEETTDVGRGVGDETRT
jgi:hypothetical protein